jgi:hypothetical protein
MKWFATCRSFGTRVSNVCVLFWTFLVRSSNVRVLMLYTPNVWHVPFDTQYNKSSHIHSPQRTFGQHKKFKKSKFSIKTYLILLIIWSTTGSHRFIGKLKKRWRRNMPKNDTKHISYPNDCHIFIFFCMVCKYKYYIFMRNHAPFVA